MHGVLPAPATPTTIATDRMDAQTGSREPDTDTQSDSDWFSASCKAILGKDAGLALSLTTGVPERSCYRYASGEREVPVLVLRAILHSEQGAPFLAALMHGCDAAWWVERQKHERMGRAADSAK